MRYEVWIRKLLSWEKEVNATRGLIRSLAVQIVVAGVTRAKSDGDDRRNRERIEAIDFAGIPAAVGDVTQRGRIPAVVALHGIRKTDVIPMSLSDRGSRRFPLQ